MSGAHAVFRFDASPRMGAGHAYRCRTLAGALSRLGWTCRGFAGPETLATMPELRDDPSLPTTAAGDLCDEAADWLIVDHYGLGADWERRHRGKVNSILVIDDLADRPHDCDLLLDQTFGRAGDDYAGLVPVSCRVLAGSDFALLRPAFARARASSLARRKAVQRVQRILVSLGATDPDNHTAEVLRGIADSGCDAAVDVVLGAAAPHLEAVRRLVTEMPQQAKLHVNVADMTALLSAADIAIGAAGTSTWERCCLGLPSFIVVIAANQQKIAAAIADAGAGIVVSGPRNALAGQIASELACLAEDAAGLRSMSDSAAQICDGRGCDRLGLALTQPVLAKDGRRLSLRLAAAADESILLEWQSHPTTRRFARNSAVPSPSEHHDWFTARRADPDCLLTLITLDDAPAGMLRLDPVAKAASAAAPAYEISILVAPDERGNGAALEALRFLRRWQGKALLIATVLPGNDASAALFEAAGYRPGADGLLYNPPPAAGTRTPALCVDAQRL